MLAVVCAVAEEIIGTGHALRARSHEGGPAPARILPRQAVGPLLRGTGVLLPDDAKVIDAAVFAASAVVVVRICAGAVVEEYLAPVSKIALLALVIWFILWIIRKRNRRYE